MRLRSSMTVLLLALPLALVSFARPNVTATPSGRDSLLLEPVRPWGINLGDRDPAVRPGDDFFRSQNGAWLARTVLDSANPAYAYWRDLQRITPRRVAAILGDAASDRTADPHSVRGMAGAFYRSFMDSVTIERLGLSPLDRELNAIRSATTKSRMAALMGTELSPSTMVGINIGQDQRAPDHYAVYVSQSGLELPGNEYYLDSAQADIKAAYQAYVGRMLTLLHWPEATARAADIVALETRIAAVSWSRQESRRADKNYNPMTMAELTALAPGFDWRAFLDGAGLGGADRIVATTNTSLPAIARIFAEAPIEVLQARQAFALIDYAAPNLNRAAAEASFDFRVKTFNAGRLNALPPRDGFRAGVLLGNAIGPMIGSLYATRYSSPEIKAAVTAMAENIRAAFDARLSKLSWMSPATRRRARAKLARMTFHVGYPDHDRDYTGLVIRDDDLYGNVVRTVAYDWKRQIRQLRQPFDRTAWVMTAQTANYNYDPTTNSVELPAGLLQPPFFDLRADPAVNYGAVGVLIGQDMVTGFSDLGRHYDETGQLRDWWTAEESAHFEALSRQVADQYSAVEPLPGIHVRGELVADQAVQDLGGWLAALDAYRLALKGRPSPVLSGFTGDQRVFLGRAQMWRAKFAVPFLRAQVVTANNAPTFLRVNGPARNMDEWYQAFDVRPGDSLYLTPERRVHLW